MKTDPPTQTRRASPAHPDLRLGFILMPQFALITVAGLVDSLRFAADAAFFSRQILCQWDWMSWQDQPVTASCGMPVTPTKPLADLEHYDYIVLAGGPLDAASHHPPAGLLGVLRQVHAQHIPIIALCSGSFVLGKAGLLDGHRCAVHFAKHEAFTHCFPQVETVVDASFVDDADIITCPGGHAIDLAAHIIRRHCGEVRAQKVLKYLLAEMPTTPAAPAPARQPGPEPHVYQNAIVQRAIAYMRDKMGSTTALKDVAAHVGTSPRQLHRAFLSNTHEAPAQYWRKLRLDCARRLLADTSAHVTTIAMDCGFADASHFIMWFRKQYGETPASYRKRRHAAECLLPSRAESALVG